MSYVPLIWLEPARPGYDAKHPSFPFPQHTSCGSASLRGPLAQGQAFVHSNPAFAPRTALASDAAGLFPLRHLQPHGAIQRRWQFQSASEEIAQHNAGPNRALVNRLEF